MFPPAVTDLRSSRWTMVILDGRTPLPPVNTTAAITEQTKRDSSTFYFQPRLAHPTPSARPRLPVCSGSRRSIRLLNLEKPPVPLPTEISKLVEQDKRDENEL
ncbi:unnamed protein product [Pleuronectes platessa]|uniref:Uncharacterized protein n=1 Tax=Pleuronectes platessa TaxID=8262 RepID=A0A9N7U4R3_PLEPL|nr:unnamed protein product [Pleuronectes platessa]